AFHALWTIHGLGAFAESKGEAFDAAKAALASADPGVRRAALAVMPRTSQGAAAIVAAKSTAHPDPPVRLEALLALRAMPASTDQPGVAGLAAGWPAGKKPALDGAAQADFAALAGNLPQSGLLQLSKLAKRWGQEAKIGSLTGKVRETALKRIADDKLSDDA